MSISTHSLPLFDELPEDIDNEEQINIFTLTQACVALLLGFRVPHDTPLDNPAWKETNGFRMNWDDAEAAGAFKSCSSVGDYLIAYCTSIIAH